MSRKLIVCLDGTGNKVEERESNILRLYKCLKHDNDQLIHYESGVGTNTTRPLEDPRFETAMMVMGLIFGTGLAAKLIHAYSFLCKNHHDGDQIYLFGYSRGAYTARALAGFVHDFGLVAPHELHLIGPAIESWLKLRADSKKRSDLKDIRIHQQFFHIRKTPIRFMGLWDTVGSLIRPRLSWGTFVDYVLHRNIDANPSVQAVAHALAIDERRRFFRQRHWQPDQIFQDPRPDHSAKSSPQTLSEVWFPGTHTDNAGSVKREEAGLSKLTMVWMREQMDRLPEADRLLFDENLYDRFVLGIPDDVTLEHGLKFAVPNAKGKIHDQLEINLGWRILEHFPRFRKRSKWPDKQEQEGYYQPKSEPRYIAPGSVIHPSAFERRADALMGYDPENLKGFEPPALPVPASDLAADHPPESQKEKKASKTRQKDKIDA